MDILIFVIALSILVLVHEGGHFFAAKKVKVKVEEFGLGLPPKIISKKIKETIFSLNWLPIGGFCRLYGEEENGKGKHAFNNKKPWEKMLIVVGGVLMNLVLAIVIFSVVYTILGVPQETQKVKVMEVVKNSPAEKAGLKEGDWIYKVGNVVIKKSDELTKEVLKYKGKKVELNIIKEGQTQGSARTIQVEVRENPPAGEGSMGVGISSIETVKIKWYQFYKGIFAGFKEAYYWGQIIFEGVLKMLGGLFTGHVPKDVSGPLGMYQVTSSIKKSQGMLALIHFFGVVSVNLAIINILPFPALDGGRIIFVLYEMIFRKKANQKFEMAVNNIGMILLLGLILLITVGDVKRIFIK